MKQAKWEPRIAKWRIRIMKVKGASFESRHPYSSYGYCFPWQGGHQCSLQLLIQPCICVPCTHYSWVVQSSVDCGVCWTIVRMTGARNQTPNLLISSPIPFSLSQMLPHCSCPIHFSIPLTSTFPYSINSYSASHDNWCTMGREWGM